MEAIFRHGEEKKGIGSEEIERWQEAEGEGLSEGGCRRGEDQWGQNESVGESVQEDEWFEEA
jgi:hypothetical protein